MEAEPACIIRADDARVHRAISRHTFPRSGFKVSFTTRHASLGFVSMGEPSAVVRGMNGNVESRPGRFSGDRVAIRGMERPG